MRFFSVETREFDADICRLMTKRLAKSGVGQAVAGGGSRHFAGAFLIEEHEPAWYEAAAHMMLYDLSYFELARLTRELLLPMSEKREILGLAVRRVLRSGGAEDIARRVALFYSDADSMNIEGFMRFRMRDVYAAWELTVLRCAEEQIIKTEYLELMGALNSYIKLQPAKTGEISVVLHPDGSCTLTDERNVTIDCERDADDGVVGVLVDLAPRSITVYDLSSGKSPLLFEALSRVFKGRIRFF